MPRELKPVLLSAALVLAAAVPALAEPGVPSAKGSDFLLVGAALAIILVFLLGLGALSTWLLVRITGRKVRFYRTALLFAAGWGCIGILTGVIPMILIGALFAGAGRTM